MNLLKKYPFANLLAVQLLSVLFYGFMGNSPNQLLFNCIGLAVPILAVWVVFRTPGVNSFAIALAVPAILLSLLASFAGMVSLAPWAHGFEALLYFYAALGLVMYMFADEVVTRDELYAAAATFTLLVWGFALVYSVCQYVYPNSIIGGTQSGTMRSWAELLFLSFSIQSGTGLSDILPVGPAARAIASIQMFSALMYITIVVSHLVGLAASLRVKK